MSFQALVAQAMFHTRERKREALSEMSEDDIQLRKAIKELVAPCRCEVRRFDVFFQRYLACYGFLLKEGAMSSETDTRTFLPERGDWTSDWPVPRRGRRFGVVNRQYSELPTHLSSKFSAKETSPAGHGSADVEPLVMKRRR